MKVLVPTGYMASVEHGAIGIELCSGFGPMKMSMPMAGMSHHDGQGDHGKGDHNKAEQPCAFAGLSAPSLAAVDSIMLALAIAFIIAIAFRVVSMPGGRAPAFLRPPLRGPPATT